MSVTSASPPLKTRARRGVLLLFGIDVAVLAGACAIRSGYASATGQFDVNLLRATLLALAPFVALLVEGLVPSSLKASLVFWRGKHALPGCEAFSKHLDSDPRIDRATLAAKLGPFPVDADAQNATWYRLYRRHSNEPAVISAHYSYLLARDGVALSVLMLPVFVAAMVGCDLTAGQSVGLALALLVQYALLMVSARTTGVRFVQTVLAVEAAS